MALTKGVNSYRTVEEADAYFETRLNNDSWEDAETSDKEKALITATSVFDDMLWTGSVVSVSQSLAFPRVGSYFDPKIGYSVTLPVDDAPARIVKGIYELALHLLTNADVLADTGSVVDIKVGSIELTEIKSATVIPPTIYTLVRPLLSTAVTDKTWFRAN